MWTASMPSTPTPRRMSSEGMRVAVRGAVRVTASGFAPATWGHYHKNPDAWPARPGSPPAQGGATTRRGVGTALRSLSDDTQAMRLQHRRDVLPTPFVVDLRPGTGCIQHDAHGAVGSEHSGQVLVHFAMLGCDDQQTSQL